MQERKFEIDAEYSKQDLTKPIVIKCNTKSNKILNEIIRNARIQTNATLELRKRFDMKHRI